MGQDFEDYQDFFLMIKVILNDDLELASDETHVIIKDFINL